MTSSPCRVTPLLLLALLLLHGAVYRVPRRVEQRHEEVRGGDRFSAVGGGPRAWTFEVAEHRRLY